MLPAALSAPEPQSPFSAPLLSLRFFLLTLSDTPTPQPLQSHWIYEGPGGSWQACWEFCPEFGLCSFPGFPFLPGPSSGRGHLEHRIFSWFLSQYTLSTTPTHFLPNLQHVRLFSRSIWSESPAPFPSAQVNTLPTPSSCSRQFIREQGHSPASDYILQSPTQGRQPSLTQAVCQSG